MSDTDHGVKTAERELSHDPRRLKWRRYAAGLSQEDAATAAGCTKSNISKLEHGQHGASAELLAALAEAYGCKTTDLMPPEPQGAVALWVHASIARHRCPLTRTA